MKTILEIVNLSVAFLQNKSFLQPRREVMELISDVLGLRPLDLYVQFDRPLNEDELQMCRTALQRRAKREPLQYIRGKVDFYDCDIAVNRDVLIPRQETELLVDRVAQTLKGESLEGKILWDICCGSGCIGIALKKAFPQLQVVLSDLSASALAMAESNARSNSVEVTLRNGDLLHPFTGERAHYVICNPPYVSAAEFAELEMEVRDFEPSMALLADENGLVFYRRLADSLTNYLYPSGKVWLELGSQQGPAVAQLFAVMGAKKTALNQDLAGHDRFFFLEME